MSSCLHIVMYPWFAVGHLTPFLHLANKLAQRGHKISFILPPKAQPKLASLNHHPDLIHFIPIAVPPVDGLPPGAELTSDLPAESGHLLMAAMELTHDAFEAHLVELSPDLVFFDFPLWLPELARKHGSKAVFYSIINLMIFGYASVHARNLPNHHHLTEADLSGPPPGFPNPDIRLHAHEAQAMANVCSIEFDGGLTFAERHNVAMRASDAIATKGCKEIEGPYCDFVAKDIGKPVLLAGPVVPRASDTSKLDQQFDSWLSGFSHASVVYCALGSECVLDKHQFQELLLGLELSGKPFLAALKPPTGCESIESGLPEGFEERTKGKGIVHGGWVQQQLILQHPSVGCFVTHCGIGSLSEAMVSECQVVLLPRAVDQFLNARVTSLELKVGVEVDTAQSGGVITKEAVNEAVSVLMDVESEVGKEVRSNHAKWREFLLKDGLEESYFTGFVQSLQELLQSN